MLSSHSISDWIDKSNLILICVHLTTKKPLALSLMKHWPQSECDECVLACVSLTIGCQPLWRKAGNDEASFIILHWCFSNFQKWHNFCYYFSTYAQLRLTLSAVTSGCRSLASASIETVFIYTPRGNLVRSSEAAKKARLHGCFCLIHASEVFMACCLWIETDDNSLLKSNPYVMYSTIENPLQGHPSQRARSLQDVDNECLLSTGLSTDCQQGWKYPSLWIFIKWHQVSEVSS